MVRKRPLGGNKLFPGLGLPTVEIGANEGLPNDRDFGFCVVDVVVVVLGRVVRESGFRLVEICTGARVPEAPPPIGGRLRGGRLKFNKGFPRLLEFSVVVVTSSSSSWLILVSGSCVTSKVVKSDSALSLTVVWVFS